MIMIFNLSRPAEKDEVNYKIIHYPDGQQDVEILSDVNCSHQVQIRSRFNSFLDLELIICATTALKRMGVKHIELFIPYLLGARCDRQFHKGGTSYLKDVVSPIINEQGYSQVKVLDAHNVSVADACINNLKVISNAALVKFAFRSISNKFVVAAPDDGASKKIFSLAEEINYDGEILVCSKRRNTLGQIIDCEIGNIVDFKGQDVVIIDDICSRGGTFIGLAKKMKMFNCGKLHLIVSHFEGGGVSNYAETIKNLSEHFDGIYTTNSVSDILHEMPRQLKII